MDMDIDVMIDEKTGVFQVLVDDQVVGDFKTQEEADDFVEDIKLAAAIEAFLQDF